jgi:mycofactocin system creatininase family protein
MGLIACIVRREPTGRIPAERLTVDTNQDLDSFWLADLTSPEIQSAAGAGCMVAVPLGSTEQHGPHLPLSTDTDVAVELCRRLATARGDVVVAPSAPYGSSGEHAGFAGTLSIGQAALELMLIELGRSATETFRQVLIVSAHGGNTEAASRAVQRLIEESRDVRIFTPGYDGDAHAGRQETAMMLALAPGRVNLELAAPGDRRPLAEIWPELRTGGVRAVSATGVLGDPTDATADEGNALLDALTADLLADVAGWRGDLHPMLAETSR